MDDGLNPSEEDEDENFQKREKTMRQENLDFFSRLMKAKTDVSVQMILTLFNNLLVQYEKAISTNDSAFIKSSEK